ncbi:MAG: hypothetical protein IPK82_06770 [Polyangiaceae bacterium]|nr:hypothetical protein [Polyangiaceae bacterium]
MRPYLSFAFAGALLISGEAHADIIADGYKPVKLTISVEADVPAGQALILAHTFRGLDMVESRRVAEVEWHPMGGPMRIMALPTSAVNPKVEELRKDRDSKALQPMIASAKPCHEPFDGIRVIPDKSAADEVRWHYKVTFSGENCTAVLTGMSFYNKKGDRVDGTGVPGVPSNMVAATAPTGSPPPATTAAPSVLPTSTAVATAASTADPKGSPNPPPEVQKGACGCELGAGMSNGALAGGLIALAGLTGLVNLRRKKRRG